MPEITTEQMNIVLDALWEHWGHDENIETILDAIRARLARYDALQANLETEIKRCASYAEEFRKVEKERDALKAEVERLQVESRSSILRDRAESAEDRVKELEANTESLKDELSRLSGIVTWKARAEKAESALAAARPLIEAAMKITQEIVEDLVAMGDAPYEGAIGGECEALLRASLAYCEQAEKEGNRG